MANLLRYLNLMRKVYGEEGGKRFGKICWELCRKGA